MGAKLSIYTLDFAITSFAHAFSARIATTTHIVLKSLWSLTWVCFFGNGTLWL
jgi:hypothetical protein